MKISTLHRFTVVENDGCKTFGCCNNFQLIISQSGEKKRVDILLGYQPVTT